VHRSQGKKIEILVKEGEIKSHPFFEIDGDIFENSSTRGAVFDALPGSIRIQT
jgi:hypothetical protein